MTRAVPLGAILITGCSSGIGRASAFALKDRGLSVIASARNPAHVSELRARGLQAVLMDVSSTQSIHLGVEEALATAGTHGIIGVFNNAGYGQAGALEDLSSEALREQLETNVVGMHEVNRLLIPHMRAMGGGRIVLNSSVLGIVAMKTRGAYVASKWAVEGYADVLRLELRPSGFHVSVIQPGPVLTRFRANSLKALDKHVDTQNSIHAQRYLGMRKRLAMEGPAVPFTVSAENCARHVVHAFTASRPKTRYRVTVQTHVFCALKRVLPTRLLDAVADRG